MLADGETLSELVDASVRAGVERRRVQSQFVARGIRSRDEARRTAEYVDADVVLEGLQRTLAMARTWRRPNKPWPRCAFATLQSLPFTCRKAGRSPFLRELILPFGRSGWVALF